MSCTIEWERVIEAAQKGRDDSVGANWKQNEENLMRVADLLFDIAKKTDSVEELTERFGG